MSGGDFLSRSEGQLCAQRKIEDRVQVCRDLAAIVKRHGEQGAHAQLGLMPGDINAIAARKKAITGKLLAAMYPPGKGRLRAGLLTSADVDVEAGASRLLAAAGMRAAGAARVMTVVEAKAVSKTLGAAMGLPEKVAVPAPAPPSPSLSASPSGPSLSRDAGEGFSEGDAALVAIARRAQVALGSWAAAAAAIGISKSYLGFLVAGTKSFTDPMRALVRAWGDANPDGVVPAEPFARAFTAEQRADYEAAALAAVGLDRPGALAIIAAARSHGLTVAGVGAQIACKVTHVYNLISGNRQFTPFIAEKLVALALWNAAQDAARDAAAATGELDRPDEVAVEANAPADKDASGVVDPAADDRGAVPPTLPEPEAAIDAALPAAIELLAVAGGETAVVVDPTPDAAEPSSPPSAPDAVGEARRLLAIELAAVQAEAMRSRARLVDLRIEADRLAITVDAAGFRSEALSRALDALAAVAA